MMSALKTTDADGHAHRVYVDSDGWGVTDYAYAGDKRHNHRVDKWRARTAAGHEHDVRREKA